MAKGKKKAEKKCPHCGKEMSKCKCKGYEKGGKK